MSERNDQNWYAVQTQPNAELKASHHLERQDYGVYLPRFMKRRRHAGRVEDVARPLFPGYIFVAIDVATQRWRCVNSTVGVRRLVCNGDAPAVVDARIIDALRNRQNEQGFITLDTTPRFVAGDAVRVIDGVFSSTLGIYEGMNDNQRVAILLELLGRKVRVHIDVDLVTAA
jgi:transcriptional antiterminator RfaH